MRWGIIGAGDIARKQTAPAIRVAAGAELYAVACRSQARARAFADELGAAKAYDSAEALLRDPAVEAVSISSPVYLHARHTIAAATARKHVLVEKPMAMSTAECRAMIDACDRTGVQLMVCYYQRFNARHQHARELVRQGAIGQVTLAETRQGSLRPRSPGDWKQDPAQAGGGAMMDLAVHGIDTLRFILGEVKAVTAFVETAVFDYPVDDTATVLLHFDNGAQGVVRAAFTVASAEPESFASLELCGTGGRICTSPLWSKDSGGVFRLLTPNGEQRFAFQQATHVTLIEAFEASVKAGQASPVPGLEGLRDLAIVEAAYQSARTGRTVCLGP